MNEWEWQLLEQGIAANRVAHAKSELKAGCRVRLRPRSHGGDAMDLLLVGKTALIEAIEQDYEGVVHLALVFDDDPGRDLGLLRQPGHRFFYSPEEVEPCEEAQIAPAPIEQPVASRGTTPPSILIAGIGNIFLGDDAFGVEVARRLPASALPSGVKVVDYGIRALDLAYALIDGPDATILVDACPRGEAAGTLFVIEPELLRGGAGTADELSTPDAHAMDPMLVIRMAQSMGGDVKRIVLVGCEPATLGPEEGQLGLSAEVEAAVDRAVALVLELVREIRDGGWPADSRQSLT